jgi:MFS family permease
MYVVGIRELFPMRSGGIGRALACIFAGLFCGGIGKMIGGLLASFLLEPSFVSPLDFGAARSDTAILASALFLLFGLGGVAVCLKLTAGLPESDLKEPDVGRVHNRTRWLVVATGLVAAVTGWSGLGLYAAVFPSVLLAGAIVQRRWQRYGFWMMFVPAAFLSSWMLPLGCFLLFEAMRALAVHHDSKMMLVSSLWATSLLLLACCDMALISEGFKLKLFVRVNS